MLCCQSNSSSVTIFTPIIISVLMGFEDLSAQRQALGNHRVTGKPFAVTARQLLGGYGFCTFPLFGNWNERCLDVRPQETEDSVWKASALPLGSEQVRRTGLVRSLLPYWEGRERGTSIARAYGGH